MRTLRTLSTVVLIVAAAVGLAACVAVDEVVNGRDVICEATSDALCLQVADAVASAVKRDHPELGPIAKVTVMEQECSDNEAANIVRCWHVETDTRPDAIGCAARLGGQARQRRDGTLFVDGWAGLALGPRPCGD